MGDMGIKTECLVNKAREKCQCDWCKQFREMRDFNLKYYIQCEVNKIITESIK